MKGPINHMAHVCRGLIHVSCDGPLRSFLIAVERKVVCSVQFLCGKAALRALTMTFAKDGRGGPMVSFMVSVGSSLSLLL